MSSQVSAQGRHPHRPLARVRGEGFEDPLTALKQIEPLADRPIACVRVEGSEGPLTALGKLRIRTAPQTMPVAFAGLEGSLRTQTAPLKQGPLQTS